MLVGMKNLTQTHKRIFPNLDFINIFVAFPIGSTKDFSSHGYSGAEVLYIKRYKRLSQLGPLKFDVWVGEFGIFQLAATSKCVLLNLPIPRSLRILRRHIKWEKLDNSILTMNFIQTFTINLYLIWLFWYIYIDI